MFDTMQTLHQLLNTYGESHKNSTNKRIHWICVPSIMFSLVGLLMAIPFPVEKSLFINWAMVFFIGAWFYYLRLSVIMFLCFVLIGLIMLWGNFKILEMVETNENLALVSLVIFTIAWIGQFIGHKIEGKKPSFLQDLQFLLIGPAWLLHFIFNKLRVKY
jgi:uncharacterized membrane protein YGL010W